MTYMIQIVMKHEHREGQQLPDCFQAVFIPLGGYGEPEWDSARPLTPPVMYVMARDDKRGTDLFGRFLQMIGHEADVLGSLGEGPGRVEFSLEGPSDCIICTALAQQELVSRGKLP